MPNPDEKIQSLKSKIHSKLQLITVEPIIFFNFLALALYYVSQHAVIYKTVCVQYYKSHDPSINCDDLHGDPALEDKVQKSSSSWAMMLSLCYMIPAVPADMFLGAWSDRHGRKVSILLGFAGLIFAAFPLILVSGYPNEVPLYVLAFSNTVAGLTGYVAIIMISSLSYLADLVRDRDSLIFRMTLVSVSRSVSEVIGSFLLGRLLKMVKPSVAILIAQVILTLGFIYSFARIRQMPPEQMRKLYDVKDSVGKKALEAAGDQHVDNRQVVQAADLPSVPSTNREGPFKELINTWNYVRQLYKEVWHTLVKPRSGHKRAYMILTIFVFFCYMMAELGLYTGPVLSLYVFHRPFFWSPSHLGTFKGIQHSFALAANILGACVMKRYLKAQETLVILFALGSGILHLTITGLAHAGWMLYLAAGVGCFNTLLIASLKSFLARQVEPDEVGKALAANGIATDLAYVCTMLIFNNVYRATVSFYSGFAFLLAAFVMFICFCITLWMHLDLKKQAIITDKKDGTTTMERGGSAMVDEKMEKKEKELDEEECEMRTVELQGESVLSKRVK